MLSTYRAGHESGRRLRLRCAGAASKENDHRPAPPTGRISNFMVRAVVLAMLALCACAAPHPTAPSNGELDVGADYTSDAAGHWVCPGRSDIIVANHHGKWLLHVMDTDWVTSDAKESADGRLFKLTVGYFVFRYQVPSDSKSPLIKETKGGSKSQCLPAPMPTYIHPPERTGFR